MDDRMTRARTIPGLSPESSRRLAMLVPAELPKGTVIFRAGEAAQGFSVVLRGRIEVNLTGPSGRAILLYAVEPGQSCVQTTLGLLGGGNYTAEAITALPAEVISIPKALFLDLMDSDAGFRAFVLTSFAQRMQDITRLLERVAFGRIECRLAAELLALEQDGLIQITHSELAARIGSAREVVTRRLDGFVRDGWISAERGELRLLDHEALRRLAATLG